MSGFSRPTGRGGWIVRRDDLIERERDTRALAAEVRERATPIERFVRKSLVSPHNDVTLPALKFMGQEEKHGAEHVDSRDATASRRD
jgi:hypothetical protein